MISVWIFTTPTSGAQWWDVSYSLESIVITTHERGYLECVMKLETDPNIARAMLAGGGTPWCEVTDNGAPVWSGRIERVGRVDGSAALFARGAYSALSDRTHTAIYAMSDTSKFKIVENGLAVLARPEWWVLKNESDGLYIAPRKNETHGGSIAWGGMYWTMPPNAYQPIYSVTFTYDHRFPAGWYAGLLTYNYNPGTAMTYVDQEWSLNGNGASQTGTTTVTVSPSADTVVFLVNDNNAAAVLGSDTGDYYLRITDIRINGVDSSPSTFDVVGGALGQVAAQNPGQINASTVLVTASESVTDAVYSNADIQDILAESAALGDGANGPVEYGVWDDKTLFFCPLGTHARQWVTDESGFEVERGLEGVWNSIRVTYTDSFGNLAGSAVAEDLLSIAHWGITRARRFESGVSVVTAADDVANTTIERSSSVVPSLRGNLSVVMDAGGTVFPLHAVRAGDTLLIRSLEYGDAAEGFNAFRISKTKFTAVVGRESLSIELESRSATSNAFIGAASTKLPTVVRPPSPQPPGVGRPPASQG